MAETTQTYPLIRRTPRPGAWGATLALLALIAIFDAPQFTPTVIFAFEALLGTAPFILFAVLAVAYLKASGAETLLAKAFAGNQSRMILMAALLGGLSPFCSCEVIPFIAALLAVGAPLGAVMAFWLASPLMDPAMFAITSGTLGWEFATAKTLSAVGVGLLGGFGTMHRSGRGRRPGSDRPARDGRCGLGLGDDHRGRSDHRDGSRVDRDIDRPQGDGGGAHL